MAPVTILDVSYIPAAAAAVPPEPIKLNAMEAQWVVVPLLQHMLLFDGDQQPPFDALVQSLRSSLAATLATHAPLAGKLHYLADTGDVAILCSAAADDGVRFVVAESDADARRLAGDEDHDVRTFERLVPELDMSLLPAPLLAVQATRLAGGGVALGFTAHHAVVDGSSLWRFVQAWAAACRGDAPPAPPVFDRSRVRLPGGEELARSTLRKYAPGLPVVRMPSSLQEKHPQITRRTFTLDAKAIGRLKQRIASEAQGGGSPPLRRSPSSFVAVVALAWVCFVRAKALARDEEDVFLFFFADARDRLDPPAGADYFGACLTGCLAMLPARELHGDRALAAAAAAVQGAGQRMVEDPLGSWPGWEFLRLAGGDATIVPGRAMSVTGSSRFSAYEVADFGWGRPRRTENVNMNHDGQVALVRARDDDGGVQASVSMGQRAQVDAFKSELLKLLG